MYGSHETPSPEFQTIESAEGRSGPRRGVAVLCAVALTAALMLGYTYLRWRSAERLRAETPPSQEAAKPHPSPQVQVFVDDAMIKGPNAVIGGTIQNISSDTLTGVTLQLELKRRRDGGSEVRTLSLQPDTLEPNQQGRYSLSVPSREYRETRIQRIATTRTSGDIAFKILPGAQRPDEKLPTREIIVVKPTPRRGNGEEFINTPDNPVKVP